MPRMARPTAPSYHTMRLAWCRLALRAFVRRWGVYFVVAALVVGAGSGSPLAAMAGLAGWTAVPLAHAAAHGAWLLPATAAQALLGLGLLAGARSLLWPVQWREAERALPLSRHELRRSDAVVVAWALLPWIALQACGLLALLAAQPAWLQPVLPRALVAWVLAQGLAAAAGVLMLQGWRRVRTGRERQPSRAGGARRSRAPGAGWFWLLLWLPLWRGPAQRSGQWLLAGSAALLLPAAALKAWPDEAGWWLAALAVAALVLVSRLSVLSRAEYAPLFEGAVMLPLGARTLEGGRQALCLLPLLPAAAATGVALGGVPLRPAVLASYALATCGSCVLEARLLPGSESDKAARWLFSLVLCVALASEVLP